MWFSDAGTAVTPATPAIGMINPTTDKVTEFTQPAGMNAGSNPHGITVGPDGNLWFPDTPTSAVSPEAIGRFGLGVCGNSLHGCNFQKADLQNIAVLPGAGLQGSNLANAQLENADLIGANLQHDNLQGAQLQNYAHLDWANLQGSHLRNADLAGADLTGATLQGSNLQGANLSANQYGGAKLDGCQSRRVQPARCQPDQCQPDERQPEGGQPARRDLDQHHVVQHHLPGRDEQQQRSRRRDLRERRVEPGGSWLRGTGRGDLASGGSPLALEAHDLRHVDGLVRTFADVSSTGATAETHHKPVSASTPQ